MKSRHYTHGLQLIPRPRGPVLAQVLMVLLCGLMGLVPAAALAQTPSLGRVAIVGVEDQNFPTVSLFLDVVDVNGAPVSGLTTAAFTVQEDGRPALVQGVSGDAGQPLALMLALDRSTDVTTWAAVQGAVAATIDALGEQDQVAITTIFEQVQAVQSFTADHDAALSALAAVVPGGQFSAINPALADAVGRFGGGLPLRRAVVLVADAPDNISGVTTEATLAQVAGLGIPIYIVGFGPRVQTEPAFAQITAATGGRFFPVASANELEATLLALLQTLRLGYRLDFVSSLQADNQPHAAQVLVNAPAVQGTAAAEFVARPSVLTVTLPSLVSGQPVAGVINLTAQVAASGPLAAVEYQVDGQLIGTAADAATPVVWDTSTLTPGPHTLTVIVTDQAGNRGEAAVEVRIAAAAPRLDLTAVDAANFPRVTLYVDAFGANGLPLVGLSGQSFVVREDNQPVNPGQTTAQVDATQPLYLVLVLDQSVTAADWAQLRNATNSLVDGLRPQDQAAIYTFAAAPALVQGATGDRGQLKQSLAAVQPVLPGPDATDSGLNQAMLDAVNYAGTLPAGRRALVVVTNSLDNAGQIALNDALNVIEAQPIPVHLIGFGTDPLTAGTLAGIAQVGKGNSVTVNSAADIRATLQTLLLLLQQGYRIDYTSALRADDLSHRLTVSLAGAGIEAEASGDLIAHSRPITVTIPNVVAGSTIAGPVNLTAQADAPAPLVAVEYLLNGDVLASVADTSFSIVWNSDTVAPGDYTVVVNVTDAVGNTGTASVALVVVAPIAVTAALGAANTDGDILVGDEVTVNAAVEVFQGKARVEFYVDRTLVGTDNNAPYTISFNSTDFGPGRHTITVVARDDSGREAISTVDFDLVAPPVPTPEPAPPTGVAALAAGWDWGRLLTWAGIGLVSLLALLAGVIGVGNWRRRAAEQKLTPMRVTLTNQGNAPTAYLVRGDDSQHDLVFHFSLNGRALGLPPVARFGSEAAAAHGNGNGAGNGTGPGHDGVSLPNLPGNAQMPSGEQVGKWADTVSELSGVAGIIVMILQNVAYLLPSPLARTLRTIAMQIRRGQMTVRRVETVRRQVDRLNQTEVGQRMVQTTGDMAHEMGEYATAEETRTAIATGAGRAGGAVTSTAGAAYAGATRTMNKLYDLSGGAKSAAAAGVAAATGVLTGAGARQWVYVPTVNAGDSITIDVMVGSKSHKGGEHQPFRILSRAVGDENAQPVVEEGSIRLARKSKAPALLGLVIAGALVLAAGVVVWWLVAGLF